MPDVTVEISGTDTTVNVSVVEAAVNVTGVPGPAGGAINPSDYFQTALRFSELDTAQKKADARTNLELQYIDCGTFN